MMVSSLKTVNPTFCAIDTLLPIHEGDEKRVDIPPISENGQTDHSTQPSCQEASHK